MGLCNLCKRLNCLKLKGFAKICNVVENYKETKRNQQSFELLMISFIRSHFFFIKIGEVQVDYI
jgi:hypothetical protein